MIFCSRFSITIWVRALSSVPISGSARMFFHSCTTGVESSSNSCCWRRMICSRFFWYTSIVNNPSRSSSVLTFQVSSASTFGSAVSSALKTANNGCLSEKTKFAVSIGENPWRTRACEISVNN